MNVGSLFSGIGGIDLGLERAGMHIAWQCEADEWRRGVLAERFPGVACYPDVRDVGDSPGRDERPLGRSDVPRAGVWDQAERRGISPDEDRTPGRVDLVCGGFPCQDLSVAGARAGLHAGTRSSLFFECARVADAVLPAGGWLLIENVPGLLSSQRGRDFAVVLATLADLGFHDLAWRVLDSRHFGVAQRRRRVYIVARRARGSRACTVLLEPEGGGGDPPARGEAGPGVAVASLSGLGSGGADDNDGQAGRIVTVARAFTQGERYDGDTETFIAGPLATGQTPNGHGMAGVNQQAAQSNHTVAVSQGVRRLTPVECERLQGFPDGWTDLGPDSRRYAALGDAVTVPVATWIGRRIMEAA